MLRLSLVAFTLVVATTSVQATYYDDYNRVDVQEYVVRERHWNDWDDGETHEYRYRERRSPAWDRGRGRGWGPPRHAHREYREYCPPPQRVYRGRVIERIEAPRFNIRFDYRGR